MYLRPPMLPDDTPHTASVLEVNALDAVADARQHLVGNGLEHIGEHRHGQVVAENLHLVALPTVYARHVNHSHVHTDVADIGCLLSVHEAVAVAVTESAIQSVGISDRYGSYHAVVVYRAFATVAHRVARRHAVYLQDGGLQCRHIIYNMVVARVYTVESKTESAHVELTLWEMLYACRVVDMTYDVVGESGL